MSQLPIYLMHSISFDVIYMTLLEWKV